MTPGLAQAASRRSTSLLLVSAVMALCATCNYGEVVVVEPAATGHGPLTLSFQVDGEDSAVARELGWTASIPGASITITAGGGDPAVGPPVAVLQTDSAGRVSVPDLADGNFFVGVRRLLTAAEASRLAPTEDVVGFMAQTVVSRGSSAILVPASRRHSLVISEWSFFGEPIPGVGGYNFGGYIELANNSDTTVYLDGLVIGQGYAQAADYPLYPCASTGSFSNDPDGVWADSFDSLPGTGHTYPLAPGAVTVIATDAIDHSNVSPEGLDLSHADFESIGTADVDNPDVPNTVTIGFYSWFLNHGLLFYNVLAQVVFIALPLDTAALPRQWTSVTPRQYGRVPRAKILDVVSLLTSWNGFTEPLCAGLVHRNFDRYRARLMTSHVGTEGDAGRWSVHRRVAYIRADGRKILQHTRTSAADFFLGLRTPFQLP